MFLNLKKLVYASSLPYSSIYLKTNDSYVQVENPTSAAPMITTTNKANKTVWDLIDQESGTNSIKIKNTDFASGMTTDKNNQRIWVVYAYDPKYNNQNLKVTKKSGVTYKIHTRATTDCITQSGSEYIFATCNEDDPKQEFQMLNSKINITKDKNPDFYKILLASNFYLISNETGEFISGNANQKDSVFMDQVGDKAIEFATETEGDLFKLKNIATGDYFDSTEKGNLQFKTKNDNVGQLFSLELIDGEKEEFMIKTATEGSCLTKVIGFTGITTAECDNSELQKFKVANKNNQGKSVLISTFRSNIYLTGSFADDQLKITSTPKDAIPITIRKKKGGNFNLLSEKIGSYLSVLNSKLVFSKQPFDFIIVENKKQVHDIVIKTLGNECLTLVKDVDEKFDVEFKDCNAEPEQIFQMYKSIEEKAFDNYNDNDNLALLAINGFFNSHSANNNGDQSRIQALKLKKKDYEMEKALLADGPKTKYDDGSSKSNKVKHDDKLGSRDGGKYDGSPDYYNNNDRESNDANPGANPETGDDLIIKADPFEVVSDVYNKSKQSLGPSGDNKDSKNPNVINNANMNNLTI